MDLETVNKYLKNPILQIIIVLLLLYILLPDYLSSSAYLCEGGKITVSSCLDSSWLLSINLALEKGLVFGKDYVFTYGPLGFLSTRTAFGFNPRWLVLFDIFILANLAYVLLYTIRKYCNLQTVVLCFLTAFTVASGSMYVDQVVFILLLISIFWLSYSLKSSQVWGLIIPVVVTSLLFYIKVNISFVALVIFYGYLIYFIVVDKRNYLAKVLFGLSVPCVILLLSFPLNTSIIGYIRGGLNLVDGYNDAMNIELGEYKRHLVYAIIMMMGFFAFFLRKNFKANLFLLLAGLLFSFVLYKQAFVRSDLHITAFFAIFPGICGILLIFYEKISSVQLFIAGVICVFCLSVGMNLDMYPNLKDRLNYLADIKSPPDLSARYENNFTRFQIPDDARKAIGQGSVDIIPWNIDYVYFNHLNYNPRPVVQSYTVYTPYLTDINGQKYESGSAPDFVIFSNQSIDNRYGFFDDQEAKLALIKDYSCIKFFDSDADNKFLLFQKTPNVNTVSFSPPIEKSVNFFEDYNLEDSNKIYFVKFNIDYTLFGRLARTFYRPPRLVINFTLEDGTTRRYRVIVPVLNNGVLINPIVEEEKDFFNLVQGIPATNARKLKSFRIDLDLVEGKQRKIAEYAFHKSIKLEVSEVSITKNN